MYVDSYLEMFTTLFGWMFYNNLWYVLKDTGLLLLPFIGIVLDHLINYKNGVEVGDAEELAIKGVISELLIACIIIMMCGVPYMNFQATEMVFTPPAMDDSFQLSSYSVNSLESTFGTSGSFDAHPIEVNVPIFWWGVHNVSIGITHAVMSGVPPTLNLRKYIESLNKLTVEDPLLRAELGEFRRDCYTKALSTYNLDKPNETGPYVSLISALMTTHGDEDPYWFGSHIFQDIPGYYDSLRAEQSVPNFPYAAARDQEWDVSDPLKPEFGRPYCDNWWANTPDGLRARIVLETDWIDALSATIETAITSAERQDLLAQVALHHTVTNFVPRGYDFAYSNTFLRDGVISQSIKTGTKQLLAKAAIIKERAANQIDITMLLNATPIIQALLLMLIVVFIPFVLFLSKYSISAVLAVAWALFSFRFLTACWMYAWWIDQNVIAALYPDAGDITTGALVMPGSMRSTDDLLYILSNLYIIIPLIFTIVTGWAGYNIIRGLGAGQMMGGLSSAGSKTTNKGMNTVQNMIKK